MKSLTYAFNDDIYTTRLEFKEPLDAVYLFFYIPLPVLAF
jgi:hypothetical protein